MSKNIEGSEDWIKDSEIQEFLEWVDQPGQQKFYNSSVPRKSFTIKSLTSPINYAKAFRKSFTF